MRILLAEDDENIRTILQLILERMGQHVVILAADGEEALHQALTQDLDVILLDGMMPKKSGLQVFRELRIQRSDHAPVIYLSAKTDRHEISEFLENGAGHLQKPFDPTTVCSRIDEILNLLRSKSSEAA